MALRHFQWQMRPNQPQCFSSSARLRCIVGNRIVRHYPGGTSVPVALHQSWSTPLPTMPRGALGRQMQCWRTAGHFVPGPRLNVGKIHRIGREALSHRKTGLNLPSRASRSPKSPWWVVSLGVVLARALPMPQKGLRMREWATGHAEGVGIPNLHLIQAAAAQRQRYVRFEVDPVVAQKNAMQIWKAEVELDPDTVSELQRPQ